MSFVSFISTKYLKRNIKKTLTLFLGITLISMLSTTVLITVKNSIGENIYKDKLNYGDWHLSYRLADTKALQKVRNCGFVDAACRAKRLQKQQIKDDDCSLDQVLLSDTRYDMMTPRLTKGSLPKNSREIIVEDWFLKKSGVKALPSEITAGGITYKITGAFQSTTQSIGSGTVRAFGSLEKNTDIENPANLSQIPVDNNYLSCWNPEEPNSKNNTEFIFIRLKDGAHVDDAVRYFSSIKGLGTFGVRDVLKASADFKKSSPVYNVNLISSQGLKGADAFKNGGSGSLYLIPTIILYILMFVITYVLLNIIISGRIREMGLLSCLGLEPVRLSRIVITETALISLFSIPLGILLSILISFLFLSSTVGKLMGTVLIPAPEILLNFAFCFIVSILASLYPSMKLRGLSPVEATGFKSGFIPNAKNKSFPKLDLAHGKIKFALLFGVKNALRNKRRFFSVSAVIALLLAFFISFGQSVETDWILAGGRKGYTPDYTISVPYISYTNKGIELNRHVTPVTDKFLHSISSLKGISNIYEQRSVADECDDSDAYEYYFDFGKNVLPEQAEKYLDSVCPVKRSGYPNDFFVMAGIGGYGDKELEFAKKYLCEGDVDIAKMDSQPVILLPKYVNVVANVNIPCTRLKVGDKVTLIENGAKSSVDISILKRYTFTVGGFLNAMPFEQINGASNGFLAVMSAKQFEKLGTAHKGIMQIYLQKKNPSSDLTAEISRLSGKYGYTVTDNKNNFADKEYEQEQKNYKLCVYSLFCLVGLMIFLTVTSLLVSDIVMRGAEFTMLWAIGLKRGQLIVSVLSEFLLYGVLGSIVGSAVGILMVFSNKTLSSDQKLLTKLQLIPWTHIKIAVLLILVLCAAVSVLGIRLCTKNMSVRNITND